MSSCKLKVNSEKSCVLTEESNEKKCSTEVNNDIPLQKRNSGSATGNPRNKCTLKPGHSLMDWIRLGASGKDLAGHHGIMSSSDLAQHSKQEDAWIAIRGKVYNITQYLDFHPGGVDEIMKGAGKDATKLFDDIHAWVNYEQLLSKCYIGPLRNSGVADIRTRIQTLTPTSSKIKLPLEKISLGENTNIKEIIPRFDWIQKYENITFIFYTSAFCNPGLYIQSKSPQDIIIKILINQTLHCFDLHLLYEIKFPFCIKCSHETGKIEIIMTKQNCLLWTNYGTVQTNKTSYLSNFEINFKVSQITQTTHDSYAIILKPIEKIQFLTPIGYHFALSTQIDGCNVNRSYTPVPKKYLPIVCTNECIPFLIKSYASGLLSKRLTTSHYNSGFVILSLPRGNFSLETLVEFKKFGFLVAGSGCTPIFAILDHLILRKENKVESIKIYFFNKTEQDIWCRNELKSISDKDPRVLVNHVLSEADETWSGIRGRISNKIISNFTEGTFYCICGPQGFNDAAKMLLTKNGFKPYSWHIFQG